jgi:hypothetical protein
MAPVVRDKTRVERVAFISAAALILVVAFFLRSQTLDQPIEAGVHDLGIRQALAARNLLDWGIFETHGAMVLNGGPTAPHEFEVYSHHPTLLPMIFAGAFAMFGDTLRVYRLTGILISLAAIALLMRLVASTWGRAAALAAGWVCCVCPLSAFYATGGDVLGEGLNLFTLGGVAFRILGRSLLRRGPFAAELGCYTLASLHDWSGLLAFGIPLADAIITRSPRASFRRGFLALGASVLVFGLMFAWGHFVVPARFPGTDGVGNTLTKWTLVNLLAIYRQNPDLLRYTLSWFADTELRIWTLPVLLGVAFGLVGVAAAGLRRRLPPSGGRILVLLLVPGVAYVIVLIGCFLGHPHAPILFLPALATGAGAFASFAYRLGVLGRCVVIAWAVWCGWEGISGTRNMFLAQAFPELQEISVAAAGQSPPDALLVTSHRVSWVIAYYARRNVVAGIQTLDGNRQVDAYLARHPAAPVLFLFPPPTLVPEGHPGRDEEIARYHAMERALEAQSRPRPVAGWRIYSIK